MPTGWLIGCFVRLGQWGSELRQYGSCEESLKYECGTAPSPETHALYSSIVRGDLAKKA